MNNGLQHAGIKGMKWGQRRFQNKDGSLTPEGKKRYGIGDKHGVSALDRLKIKRKAAANKKGQPVKKPTVQKTPAQIKKEQEAAREAKRKAVIASRSPQKMYDNAHLFTTEELKAAKLRFELERDIKNLEPEKISKGEAAINKMKKGMDLASGLMDSGIKTYNNIAKLYNSLTDSGRENPWPTIDKKGDKSMTKKAKSARKAEEEAREQAKKDREQAKKESAKESAKAAREGAYKAAYDKTKEAFDEYYKEHKKSKANKQKSTKRQKATVEGEGRSKARRFYEDNDNVVDGEWREVNVDSVYKSPQRAIGENYIMALLEDKRR